MSWESVLKGEKVLVLVDNAGLEAEVVGVFKDKKHLQIICLRDLVCR